MRDKIKRISFDDWISTNRYEDAPDYYSGLKKAYHLNDNYIQAIEEALDVALSAIEYISLLGTETTSIVCKNTLEKIDLIMRGQ